MTKNDVIRMAREAGIFVANYVTMVVVVKDQLEAFYNLAAAAEREECAKLCEDLIGTRATAEDCADAIRARGNK